jgi:hypothetical protein
MKDDPRLAELPKANIAPRPNVAPRDPDKRFTEDRRFLRNIRGRLAVKQVLRDLGYGEGVRATDASILNLLRSGILTEEHLFYLEEAMPCIVCRRIPVGIDFTGRRVFTCDRPDCRRQ